jgi:hypothetical protein
MRVSIEKKYAAFPTAGSGMSCDNEIEAPGGIRAVAAPSTTVNWFPVLVELVVQGDSDSPNPPFSTISRLASRPCSLLVLRAATIGYDGASDASILECR